MASEMTPVTTRSMDLRDEGGFSMIESMIALTTLGVGLLTMAMAFAAGLQQMSGSNFDFLAREKAAEAVETVFTARDTRTITWARIRNVNGASGTDAGVFVDGAQTLKLAGTDGLVNTADDSNTLESIPQPGPDGMLGNGDDTAMALTAFTREIEIRDLGPTLRRLRVIIRYVVGNRTREYIIETYISSYA